MNTPDASVSDTAGANCGLSDQAHCRACCAGLSARAQPLGAADTACRPQCVGDLGKTAMHQRSEKSAEPKRRFDTVEARFAVACAKAAGADLKFKQDTDEVDKRNLSSELSPACGLNLPFFLLPVSGHASRDPVVLSCRAPQKVSSIWFSVLHQWIRPLIGAFC